MQFAGLPTPRDTEASNAYALMHDALGPVCICSLIGINSIDVAIGAAKFRGEYTGGMPTLGCPECNGETMEYVAQEP